MCRTCTSTSIQIKRTSSGGGLIDILQLPGPNCRSSCGQFMKHCTRQRPTSVLLASVMCHPTVHEHSARDPIARPEAPFFGSAQPWHGPVLCRLRQAWTNA